MILLPVNRLPLPRRSLFHYRYRLFEIFPLAPRRAREKVILSSVKLKQRNRAGNQCGRYLRIKEVAA